jgi:hypothetical protein
VPLNRDLLTRAAFDPPEMARTAWKQWCDAHRLDDLDPSTSLILPVILANLRGDDLGGEIADRARLDGISRHWRVRQHVLLAAADDIAETLHRARQRCALIEGAALGLLAYPESVVRPGYYVAILVDGRAIDQVAKALAADGWEAVDTDPFSLPVRQFSSGCVVVRNNARVTVRWDLVRDERQAALDADELRRSPKIGSRTVIRPEGALFSLLADPPQDTEASLLWESDVRQLLRLTPVDFHEVARMTRDRGAARVVRRSLAQLESSGVVLPRNARHELILNGPRQWMPSALAFDLRRRRGWPSARSRGVMHGIARAASFAALTRDRSPRDRAALALSRARSRLRTGTTRH